MAGADRGGPRRDGGGAVKPRLGRAVSRNTLLRVVRRLPLPVHATPTVLGVDDWAYRKRQTYGTILIDLERRRPVALLHDREAGTLAQWLKAHPGVEIMARDRSKAYADGARQGAPEAIQVADRFHLLQNVAEALEQVCRAHGPVLTAVNEAMRQAPIRQADGTVAVPVPLPPPAPTAQELASQRRARRLATYEQVWALHRQGWYGRGHRPAAGHRANDRRFAPAVRRHFPNGRGAAIAARVSSTPTRTTWSSAGMRAAVTPASAVRSSAHGATAAVIPPSPAIPSACVRPRGSTPRSAWERKPSAVAVSDPASRRSRPPGGVAGAATCGPATAVESQQLTQLRAQPGELAEAIALAQDFVQLVRQRQPDSSIPGWSAPRRVRWGCFSALPNGLRDDYAAVKAGMTLPWSTGPVEGHINRLKMLKRQMFGRARLDLLSRRFLLAPRRAPQPTPRPQAPAEAQPAAA